MDQKWCRFLQNKVCVGSDYSTCHTANEFLKNYKSVCCRVSYTGATRWRSPSAEPVNTTGGTSQSCCQTPPQQGAWPSCSPRFSPKVRWISCTHRRLWPFRGDGRRICVVLRAVCVQSHRGGLPARVRRRPPVWQPRVPVCSSGNGTKDPSGKPRHLPHCPHFCSVRSFTCWNPLSHL